jgi:hypothetical protein
MQAIALQLGAVPLVNLALTAGVITVVSFILRSVIHYHKLGKFPLVNSFYFSAYQARSHFVQCADELLRYGFSKVSR